MLCFLHEIAENHQESRHNQENREQGEHDGLDQADGHIRPQLKLHEHHGDQATDGSQAACTNLRNCLGQRDDDGLSAFVRLIFFLKTVAVDDRIVQGQSQLQDGGHRVRNKGNLSQQEVGARVQNRCDNEREADDSHIRIGIRCESQNRHHNHRHEGRNHVDFFLDRLRHCIDHSGGDKGIIIREHPLYGIQRVNTARIRLFIVKCDRKQCRCVVIMLCSVVELRHLDAFHLPDLFK